MDGIRVVQTRPRPIMVAINGIRRIAHDPLGGIVCEVTPSKRQMAALVRMATYGSPKPTIVQYFIWRSDSIVSGTTRRSRAASRRVAVDRLVGFLAIMT